MAVQDPAHTGLSEEQLVHFSEHGWVLLEAVLDEDACQAYIRALDRCSERRVSVEPRREDSLADEELRDLLGPAHYRGQHAEA